MNNRKMIIASTSTVHGSGYLEYLLDELKVFFKGTSELIFIPYARPSGITHDDYTARAASVFEKIGIAVKGLHEFDDPVDAIRKAEAVFTGGGNTFLLVSQLYRFMVMEPLRESIFAGMKYLGSSAGSNITGLTMQTTNDMPIIYPSSFKTIGAIPFNLNPHYLDPIEGNTHMGETRETRINEFHTLNSQPVVGLREGSWLQVEGETITLKGDLSARIFEKGKPAYELPAGSVVIF
ncbi:dipeptidase PepE [Robertkochia solimangrovi]|uniref:dipeptidase PepE n=1 Tax=Robertkochia solimangrovi TaxID=2213046 RepID=UPI00117D5873|nr:dipeptidase PepE [Robertkochia solimangrovi]TRZ41413.1 dipeptidase PepE [Robertkochia solimangrovi]